MALFGKDHPLSLAVLQNTAGIMHMKCELESAKKLYESILPIQEQLHGAEVCVRARPCVCVCVTGGKLRKGGSCRWRCGRFERDEIEA